MAKGVKRNIKLALVEVSREIGYNASRGGAFAGAMASEGYAGGYSQALSDVLLALNGAKPNTRNYWRDAKGLQ